MHDPRRIIQNLVETSKKPVVGIVVVNLEVTMGKSLREYQFIQRRASQ
jgi:hypothetical protein